MKCRWYAVEGVCTNGECPYRGGTCPTSEHPEVCKYAEKQTEQIEIPQLNVEELVKALRLCGNASCTGCALYGFYDCGSIINPQAADMLEKLAEEKDAKNRVLALKEVEAYCAEGADAAPLWVEFDRGINRWVLIAPVRETCKMDFVSKYLVIMSAWYGEGWRCWLRKPTKEEMEGTPWEENRA